MTLSLTSNPSKSLTKVNNNDKYREYIIYTVVVNE